MSRLRIAVIVEGDGEVQAIRELLDRIWYELLGGEYLEIPSPPIRVSRSKLIPKSGIINKTAVQKAVDLAASKLRNRGSSDPAMILLLLDSDSACPRDLGPALLQAAQEHQQDMEIVCVLAHKEYETWFVAAAESLRSVLAFDIAPEKPEETGAGKKWVEDHFQGPKYSETVDQPSMSSKMDLTLCRSRSPSFDRLCRKLSQCLKSSTKE